MRKNNMSGGRKPAAPPEHLTFTYTYNMQRLCSFCFSIVFVVLFVGCGGSGNVPLSGKVTFSDDGSPLAMGTVVFLKDGHIARGRIEQDGTYAVSFGEKSGLPPGTYQVYVASAEKVTEVPPDSGNYNYEPQIDKKYESPETSELTLEVNAATKTYDIQVDRFKK